MPTKSIRDTTPLHTFLYMYARTYVLTHVHTVGMDDSSVEVRDLLNALMDKSISAEEQGIDKAGDREISMALFGMLYVMYYML